VFCDGLIAAAWPLLKSVFLVVMWLWKLSQFSCKSFRGYGYDCENSDSLIVKISVAMDMAVKHSQHSCESFVGIEVEGTLSKY
jgi:hypothetical protein